MNADLTVLVVKASKVAQFAWKSESLGHLVLCVTVPAACHYSLPHAVGVAVVKVPIYTFLTTLGSCDASFQSSMYLHISSPIYTFYFMFCTLVAAGCF